MDIGDIIGSIVADYLSDFEIYIIRYHVNGIFTVRVAQLYLLTDILFAIFRNPDIRIYDHEKKRIAQRQKITWTHNEDLRKNANWYDVLSEAYHQRFESSGLKIIQLYSCKTNGIEFIDDILLTIHDSLYGYKLGKTRPHKFEQIRPIRPMNKTISQTEHIIESIFCRVPAYDNIYTHMYIDNGEVCEYTNVTKRILSDLFFRLCIYDTPISQLLENKLHEHICKYGYYLLSNPNWKIILLLLIKEKYDGSLKSGQIYKVNLCTSKLKYISPRKLIDIVLKI